MAWRWKGDKSFLIGTNADPIQWLLYAALGGDDLTRCVFFIIEQRRILFHRTYENISAPQKLQSTAKTENIPHTQAPVYRYLCRLIFRYICNMIHVIKCWFKNFMSQSRGVVLLTRIGLWLDLDFSNRFLRTDTIGAHEFTLLHRSSITCYHNDAFHIHVTITKPKVYD